MEWQEIRLLRRDLECFLRDFNGCFARSEGRNHLRRYVQGQLSGLVRKSVEPIADQAGIPPRMAACRVVGTGTKGPVTLVQEYRHGAVALFDDRQVQVAIPVHVIRRNHPRAVSNPVEHLAGK